MKPLLISFHLLFVFFYSATAQQADVVIQTGHSSSVRHIAWSSDGRYIASVSDDGNLKLWDAKLGLEIFSWFPFLKQASYVSFSNDSRYLLATGTGEQYLYDLTTGKRKGAMHCDEEDDPNLFTSMAVFSPDGKYCFADRSGEQPRILKWETAEMLDPSAFSPDQDFNIDEEDSVKTMYAPVTGAFFEGHRGAITAIRVTNNSKYLVSSSEDSTIRIWDIVTAKLVRTIKAGCEIQDIAITPDDQFIYSLDGSSASKESLRQWNIATGKLVYATYLPRGGRCLALSNDGKTIAIGNYLKEIGFYNTAKRKMDTIMRAHDDYLNATVFNAEGTLLASAGNDNTIRVWDVKQRRMLRNLKMQISPIEKLVYNRPHNTLVSLSIEKGINRSITWETTNGIGVKNGLYGKPRISLNDVFYIDTAGTMILTTEDSSLVLREPGTGRLKQKIYSPFASHAAMNPAGNMIIIDNGREGKFYRYDLPSTTPVFFAAHPGGSEANVHTMNFSSDGKYLAVGDIGADIYVYNTATGEYLRNLNYLDADSARRKSGEYNTYDMDVSNAWVYDVKFSPDGKLLAAACRFPDPIVTGGLIIIWELATGKMLHWESAHIYPIQSINWSPDGKYLITGSNDKSVKVWEYAQLKGAEAVYSYHHGFTAMHASFTADQQWIVSAGIDGQIIIKDAQQYNTLATLISLDSADYVAVTPEQYYAASKEGLKLVSFRQGNRILPAAQFDLRYNRPDKVLEALGSRDTALIRSYKRAYEKRIRKMGIDTTSFSKGFSRPEATITGQDTMRYDRTQPVLPLKITANSPSFILDRFNIWVNDVPVYGQNGIRMREAAKVKWDTAIALRLSEGENRIEVSVIDANGTESYRQPLLVRYTPKKPVQKQFYFIGIGINRFKDSRYNLNWSVKDIRDMAKAFKRRYANATIDTLFDEAVSRENILALKNKLQGLSEDDKVVVAYSGHGLFSKDFDYFLSTYNVNFEKPEIDGLNYEDLESIVDGIKPRQKLVLIDACHSGEVDKEEVTTMLQDSLPPGIKGVSVTIYANKKVGMKNSFELMQSLFVNMTRGTGATIISAAGGTQFAQERGDLKNGVFTYSILDAFNRNPGLTVSQLKRMVSESVVRLTNGMQKPTSRNETGNHDWVIW